MKISNETKTGILILICLGVLTAFLLKVGNFGVFERSYIIKSRMEYIGGVKRHAPVRLSGVDVGEVSAIDILYGDKTLIELSLRIREGVKIRKDSIVSITTLGLMGEMYAEIKAGTAATVYANPGDILLGEGPVRLDELVKVGQEVASNISGMAKDISRVAAHVDTAVEDNRPKINRIFDRLEETSENFRDFSEDIKYHPWKILMRGTEKSKDEIKKIRHEKTNFGPKKELKSTAE